MSKRKMLKQWKKKNLSGWKERMKEGKICVRMIERKTQEWIKAEKSKQNERMKEVWQRLEEKWLKKWKKKVRMNEWKKNDWKQILRRNESRNQ